MNAKFSKKNFIQRGPIIRNQDEMVKGYPTGYGHIWIKPSLYDELEEEAESVWGCIHLRGNPQPIPMK